MIRRAAWWLTVWVWLLVVWAVGLVGREGRYPWEGDDA